MDLWNCPKCGKKLRREARSFCCEAGHSYDTAGCGYVNLLLANEKRAKLPGDNREMVSARGSFLNTDGYLPLAVCMAELLEKLIPPGGVLLDAGCGEGYYTDKLQQELNKRGTIVLATDISKYALERAAKRGCAAGYAVASSYRLPVESKSLSALTTVFAPVAPAEFNRALASGGIYLNATAGENHLIELKEILYDSVYKNKAENEEYSGFETVERKKLTYTFCLNNCQSILHLFTMTPYYYTTPREGLARLRACNHLKLTADFVLSAYRKK